MAYGVGSHPDSAAVGHQASARKKYRQALVAGIALGIVALGCGLALQRNLAVPPHIVTSADVPTAPEAAAEPLFDPALLHASYPMGAVVSFARTDAPFGPVAPVARRAAAAPSVVQRRAAVAGSEPGAKPIAPQPTAAQAAAGQIPVQPVPSPLLRAMAQRNRPVNVDDPFEKLFGKPQSAAPALAYAAPDGGVFNSGRSLTPGKLPPNDGLSAIYDITARTVYLPDGTKLEAHSGLGPKMDDPRHVHVRMHGATPPHIYDLTPREALFHGVEALRLNPVGGSEAIFGRNGLLTHTYLLGPRGDSNGCISFRDYATFLRAYKAGKIKRMIVVASLDQAPATDWRGRDAVARRED